MVGCSFNHRDNVPRGFEVIQVFDASVGWLEGHPARGTWDPLLGSRVSPVNGHCSPPALVACWYQPSGSQQSAAGSSQLLVPMSGFWNTLPEKGHISTITDDFLSMSENLAFQTIISWSYTNCLTLTWSSSATKALWSIDWLIEKLLLQSHWYHMWMKAVNWVVCVCCSGGDLQLPAGQGRRTHIRRRCSYLRHKEERRWLVGRSYGWTHRTLSWQLCRTMHMKNTLTYSCFMKLYTLKHYNFRWILILWGMWKFHYILILYSTSV